MDEAKEAELARRYETACRGHDYAEQIQVLREQARLHVSSPGLNFLDLSAALKIMMESRVKLPPGEDVKLRNEFIESAIRFSQVDLGDTPTTQVVKGMLRDFDNAGPIF